MGTRNFRAPGTESSASDRLRRDDTGGARAIVAGVLFRKLARDRRPGHIAQLPARTTILKFHRLRTATQPYLLRWHQAGGPDDITNGLSLCTLHHKLFDRGALTVSLGYRIELSEHLHGGAGFDSLLLAYHGKPMQSPQTKAYYPALEFLGWHHGEVFQGPSRPLPDIPCRR